MSAIRGKADVAEASRNRREDVVPLVGRRAAYALQFSRQLRGIAYLDFKRFNRFASNGPAWLKL